MFKFRQTTVFKSLLVFSLLAGVSILISAQTRTVRADLPENGRVRVINRRGSVQVELSTSRSVSISAEFTGGVVPRTSPVTIQRSDDELLVSLPALPATARNPQQINLIVTVPPQAKVSVITASGSVFVKDAPAELNVLSRSGNIIAKLPRSSDVDVRAVSMRGKASTDLSDSAFALSLPDLSGRTAEAQVFHVRLNRGTRAMELRTTSGNIVLQGREGDSIGAQQVTSTRPEPPPSTSPTPQAREVASAPTTSGPPVMQTDQPQSTAIGTPAPAKADQEVDEGDVVRVDTQLVTTNVSVIDRNTSHGVANLTKEDFNLYEDGKKQEIVSFDSSSAPFNLILVIDLSGSTKEVVRLIKEAALHFVDAARPADKIGVITFANSPLIVSTLTDNRDVLRSRINSIEEPKGSTKLYDSLKFSLDEMLKQASGKRRNALIVMSDGLDSSLPNVKGEGSTITFKDLIDDVQEFDGVVYSLWLDTEYESLSPEDIQPETFDLAHDRMRELADAGGGTFYEVEKLQDLAGSYERVVADLGTVYSIGYRPPRSVRDGKWRAIKVDVDRPNTVARGKKGYFAN